MTIPRGHLLLAIAEHAVERGWWFRWFWRQLASEQRAKLEEAGWLDTDYVRFMNRKLQRMGGWNIRGAETRRPWLVDREGAVILPSKDRPVMLTTSKYRDKCKRLRTDGPTPCLCCEGECHG